MPLRAADVGSGLVAAVAGPPAVGRRPAVGTQGPSPLRGRRNLPHRSQACNARHRRSPRQPCRIGSARPGSRRAAAVAIVIAAVEGLICRAARIVLAFAVTSSGRSGRLDRLGTASTTRLRPRTARQRSAWLEPGPRRSRVHALARATRWSRDDRVEIQHPRGRGA